MLRLRILVFIVFFTGTNQCSFAKELKGAFDWFSITPEVGTSSGILSRAGNNIQQVYGDLKTTVFLFEENGERFCLLTSAFWVDHQDLRPACVDVLVKNLKLKPENIITASSHNHTLAWPSLDPLAKNSSDKSLRLAFKLGQEFVSKLEKATVDLAKNLTPIKVAWGKVEENRISYNRRAVDQTGRAYFMREDDRLNIAGEGYHGIIDPDATVVLFKNYNGEALAALTNFTAHPIAAYSPEAMISFGQFPQMANDILSKHLNNIPVGFIQGCAGDINSKYMLSGTIEQAKTLGDQLGASFIKATNNAVASRRLGIQWKKKEVAVPFANFPSKSQLEEDLTIMNDFIARGKAGDENTLYCVGMNFPTSLTPGYRARLVEMVKPWYEWAIDQHKQQRVYQLPRHRNLNMTVVAFGDVGLIALPFEPFVKTGLQMKKKANFPCVIAAGYANGSNGYIPDASAVDDREYMAGHFRYVKEGQPYATPGADIFTEEGVKILNSFAK